MNDYRFDWAETRIAAQAVVEADCGLFCPDGRALDADQVAIAMAADAWLFGISPAESLRRRQPEVPVVLPDIVIPKTLVDRDDHVLVRRVDLDELREGTIGPAVQKYRQAHCRHQEAVGNECPHCGLVIDPWEGLLPHRGVQRSASYGKPKFNRFEKAHNAIRDDRIVAGEVEATEADFDRWDAE